MLGSWSSAPTCGEGGADFICLRVHLTMRTISVKIVRVGWFEIAAFLD